MEQSRATTLFSFVLITSAGDRRTWNWHENRFDEDNCNAKYLGLEEAFDALKLNAFCENDEDDKGQNVGSSLGHYDEDAADESDPNGYHFKLIPPIRQTYVVDGKTYKVCTSRSGCCGTILTTHEEHRCLLHVLRESGRRCHYGT